MSSNQKNDKKQHFRNESDSELYNSLRQETDRYVKYGIRLTLNGHPCTSYKIARTCSSINESHATYIRDFISDDNGVITEVNFQKIRPGKNK